MGWISLYAVSVHVGGLLYAGTQVGLFNLVHSWNWAYFSGTELLFDLIFVSQIFILKIYVVPDGIWSHGLILLFMLDPSVVLECILEKSLELTLKFYDLCFGAGVVNCESQLKACFSGTLP